MFHNINDLLVPQSLWWLGCALLAFASWNHERNGKCSWHSHVVGILYICNIYIMHIYFMWIWICKIITFSHSILRVFSTWKPLKYFTYIRICDYDFQIYMSPAWLKTLLFYWNIKYNLNISLNKIIFVAIIS